ncbi:hypothetical protein Tco_0319113 [Tanacetum coccineum]
MVGGNPNLDEDKEEESHRSITLSGIIGHPSFILQPEDLTYNFAYIHECARYQARPTKEPINEVKGSFSVSKGNQHRGQWYPKDSSISSNSICRYDHASSQDTCPLPTMALDSIKFQCTVITKALLPYAATTFNIPDPRQYIDIRFHFIKEHVENGVIELYFVNMEKQLEDNSMLH